SDPATFTDSFSNNTGSASGSHAVTDCGTWTAKLYISPGALPPSDTFDVTGCVTNTPPTVDAGGPYTGGDEGANVNISGTATDNEDALTTQWTYSVVSADAGATCSFGNAALLSTTVNCTDDGTFKLTLTA